MMFSSIPGDFRRENGADRVPNHASVIMVGCLARGRQSTGEEVCQVAGRISPHELARKLGVVCRMSERHSCIIERNNHGHTVIVYAKQEEGVSLYQTEVIDKITDQVSEKVGWDTNERSKSQEIDTLSRDLEVVKRIPHSAETFEELRTFVHGERGE